MMRGIPAGLLFCILASLAPALQPATISDAVKPTDREQRTCLHSAAMLNSVRTAARLIAEGADVNAKDRQGWTPLDMPLGGSTPLLAMSGYGLNTAPEPADRLVTVDPNLICRMHRSLLQPRESHAELLRLLVEKGASVESVDRNGSTPLHIAAGFCGSEDVRLLLQSGARPSIRNKLGQTPLHIAIIQDNRDAAEALLVEGADPRIADAVGNTPLHLAAKLGRRYMIGLLLSHGADINRRNRCGDTPLHLAVNSELSYTYLLLMAHGADTSIKNNSGQTPSELSKYSTIDHCNEADCAGTLCKSPAARVTEHIIIEDSRLNTASWWSVHGMGALPGTGIRFGNQHRGIPLPQAGARNNDSARVSTDDDLLLGATTPFWSHGGRLIGTHLGIWRLKPGRKPAQILKLRSGVGALGFSPNDREFAYLKLKYKWVHLQGQGWYQRRLRPDLCLVDIRTGSERIVAKDVILGSWSPAGNRFALYRSNRPISDNDHAYQPTFEGFYSLYLADADGSHEILVTSHRLADGPPAWSPDGRRLAFADREALAIVNSDGSGLRKAWIRDHAVVDEANPLRGGFAATPMLEEPILAGSRPVSYVSYISNLSWSQDGRSVTFLASTEVPGETTITRMRLASLDVSSDNATYLSKVITDNPPIGRTSSMEWSPDRTRIATLPDYSGWCFETDFMGHAITYGPEKAELSGIWIMRADGSGLTQAVELYEPWRTFGDTQSPWSISRPAWSPDGHKIAAVLPSVPEKLHVLSVQ